MKILLTGFTPFGNSPLNPSQQLIETLPDIGNNGETLIKAILPVDHIQAQKLLLARLHQTQPDAVLMFGLASGRPKICLERIAINLQDYRIPDNAGVTITDEPIVAGGPAAYFSTLPVRAMLSALQAEGIPVRLSLSAGAYLCNQVFYTLMHEIAQKRLPSRAGFIHLPALPAQAAESNKDIPSMSLDQEIQAAHILIRQLHPA